MSATCVIASYGPTDPWFELGERARMSAECQTVAFEKIVRIHLPGGTLQDARNVGAAQATGEWLCFLDADDELDAHYHEAMLQGHEGIRRPATLGIVDGVEDDYPVMIPRCDLRLGNFIVIGAFIKRQQFLDIGGFGNDRILEDWDLYTRLHLAGAEIEDIPEAIYRVHVRPNSRNQHVFHHGRTYSDIKNRYREQWQLHEEMRQVVS